MQDAIEKIYMRVEISNTFSPVSHSRWISFQERRITSIRIKWWSLHDCQTLLFGPFDMTYQYLQWESRFSEARVLFLSELMIHTFSVFMWNQWLWDVTSRTSYLKINKWQRHHDMTFYRIIFVILFNLCIFARVVHVIVLCRTWHLTSDIVSQYRCLNVFLFHIDFRCGVMYMTVLVVQLWRLWQLFFENNFELWCSWRDDLEVFDWSKGFRFMIGYMIERYDKGSWSENRDLFLSWSEKVIEDNSFTQFWHYGKDKIRRVMGQISSPYVSSSMSSDSRFKCFA